MAGVGQFMFADPALADPEDALGTVVLSENHAAQAQVFDGHSSAWCCDTCSLGEANHPGVVCPKTLPVRAVKGQAAACHGCVVGIIRTANPTVGLVQNTVVIKIGAQLTKGCVESRHIDEVGVCCVPVAKCAGVSGVEIGDRIVAVSGGIDERVVAIATCDGIVVCTTVQ